MDRVRGTIDDVTCSSCLFEYDNRDHKPKFLQCFHTLCLQCLQNLLRGSNIICPICGKMTSLRGADRLSDNTHALYCAEMKDPKKSAYFCNEQVSLKDEGSLRFKTAILKRQDVQQRFQEMLQSLNAVKAEITQQSYVNDLKLRELTKKLEDHEKIVMKMKELESAASRCRLQLEESNKNLQFAMAQCSIDETEMLPEVTIEMKIEGPSTTSFVEVDEVHSDHKKRLLSLLISSIITNPGATTTREPDSHTENELSVTDETVYPIQNYLYSCEDTTF